MLPLPLPLPLYPFLIAPVFLTCAPPVPAAPLDRLICAFTPVNDCQLTLPPCLLFLSTPALLLALSSALRRRGACPETTGCQPTCRLAPDPPQNQTFLPRFCLCWLLLEHT